jgi:hypothetical protein
MSTISSSLSVLTCQGNNNSNRYRQCYNRARPGFHTCGTHKLQEESIIAEKEAAAAAEAKRPAALWAAIPADSLSPPVAAFLQAQLTQMLELQREVEELRMKMDTKKDKESYGYY